MKKGFKMHILAITIPLLALGGAALLIWRMHAAQRADADYHAGLTRSIQLASDAFADQGDIPLEFSCEGKTSSPPLAWSNLPENTRSLVLLATDEDLPTPRLSLFKIVHWVLYDIPSDATRLPAGVTDAELDELGITTGRNWERETQYYPPCPISGRHRYVFRLYALDVESIQPETNNRTGVLRAIENHVLAYGELNGFYKKRN